MITVYPFGSASLYTSSYAVTSSFATSASLISYVFTASNAATVLFPESGSRGKSVCLLTPAQFNTLVSLGTLETCNFNT